jgi:hypothetical protein
LQGDFYCEFQTDITKANSKDKTDEYSDTNMMGVKETRRNYTRNETTARKKYKFDMTYFRQTFQTARKE